MLENKIIVALDVASLESAIDLLDKLPDVSFWKVGLELFVSSGPEIIAILKERQKRIFLDLKFHDIPNTVAGACRAAAKYNVDLLTIHSTCGKEALKAGLVALEEGAAAVDKPSPKLIAITLLTSLNSRQLAFELKIPLELPEYALHMALLAKETGLAGAVCSPQEVEQLRRSCGMIFCWFVPACVRNGPMEAIKGDR